MGSVATDYVENREGGLYVAGSRVSLVSVIFAFRQGASPETIRQSFPSLTLAQAYGAIAYYLNNPAESDAYIAKLQEKWRELERDSVRPDNDLQARFDSARQRFVPARR